MNPGRLVIAYLTAPVMTALLWMVWGALNGGFELSDFSSVLFFCSIPHLGATISWIPFVILREPSRFGRSFYLGAGAASGLVSTPLGGGLFFGFAPFHMAFTILGALSALIFREIAATGPETI